MKSQTLIGALVDISFFATLPPRSNTRTLKARFGGVFPKLPSLIHMTIEGGWPCPLRFEPVLACLR